MPVSLAFMKQVVKRYLTKPNLCMSNRVSSPEGQALPFSEACLTLVAK